MGRPPSNGGPAFRFSAKEAAEMESILQEHKIKMPSNDVIEALAEKFSQSAERAGKMSVQVKQVWNWFQNRRFALRSKLPRPLPAKATPVSAVPQDMAPVRNAPLVSQPQPVQIDHEGLNTKTNPSSEKQDHDSSELEEGDCCEASRRSGSFHIQNKKMVENIGNSMAMGKEKSFVWTDALTRILIEMLTEYQRQNGKNGFSWIYLTESFEQKTNLKCKKETLKNKYNNMRGVWKLWTTLKHGETELGWDSEKQCIAASAEWWAQKLQENKEYRIFKRNGFSPEIESMLKFLFQGTIGTESHCVAPFMVQKAPVPNSILYQENVAASSKANHAMVPILEADANSAAQVASNQPKNTCAEALKIIEVMVEEGFLVQGSSLWCFAISMLCSGANRKIFTLLRSNKARLPWLEWEFKIEGKKGLLPDD